MPIFKPLFKPGLTQQYGPKSIKFSDLYQHATKNDLSDSVQSEIIKKLTEHGYCESELKTLFNKGLSISKAKEIATHLGQSKLDGFKRSATRLVNDYIFKEAVKNKNVGRVKHELALEVRREPLKGAPGTSRPAKSPLKKLY